MRMKNWTKKQLTDYKLIDRVNEDHIREFFSSKTHDCDLRIIGVHWSSLNNEKALHLTAVGEYEGKLQRFKFKVMNPTLPRVKSLEEILDAKIFGMCHYGQYTAVAGQRRLLTCYCKIEKTDGKKFNLSTSALDKDLGSFINSLPSRRSIQTKDANKFNNLSIRDLRDL